MFIGESQRAPRFQQTKVHIVGRVTNPHDVRPSVDELLLITIESGQATRGRLRMGEFGMGRIQGAIARTARTNAVVDVVEANGERLVESVHFLEDALPGLR